MMEAEIYAIRKALKMISHTESDFRNRATKAEKALDAIEEFLRTLPAESASPKPPAPKLQQPQS